VENIIKETSMISDTALSQCQFTAIGTNSVLKTPLGTIDCQLPIPEELCDALEARDLTDSEIELVQYLRDVEGYKHLTEMHRYFGRLTVGDVIAIAVARNLGTSVKNLTDDGIVIPMWKNLHFQHPSNYVREVHVGATYDIVTDHGLAKVMVIEKVTEPAFATQHHHVKVMMMNDGVYPIPKRPYPATQFSMMIVPTDLLIKETTYYLQ
jgi:hypothetical protein